MNISNASLPYPVLGREDDYIGVQPEAWIKQSSKSNDKLHLLTYTVSFDKGNKDLIKLVKEGYAELIVELDCRDTFIRKCFRYDAASAAKILASGEGSFDIQINKKDFAGYVSVCGYITAVQYFTLKNTGRFHSDYEDVDGFEITPGDVLAVFPCAEKINLSFDWEHMYRNAGAPVTTVKDEDSKSSMIYTMLGQDNLEIHLPPKMYVAFKSKFEEEPLVASGILVTLAKPAIMSALNFIMENPSESRPWALAVKNRIDTEKEFISYRPENGDWEHADLSGWKSEIEKIASLFLRDAVKDYFKACSDIIDMKNER